MRRLSPPRGRAILRPSMTTGLPPQLSTMLLEHWRPILTVRTEAPDEPIISACDLDPDDRRLLAAGSPPRRDERPTENDFRRYRDCGYFAHRRRLPGQRHDPRSPHRRHRREDRGQ